MKDKWGYDRVFVLSPVEKELEFQLRQVLNDKKHYRMVAYFDWGDEEYAKICLNALNDEKNYPAQAESE